MKSHVQRSASLRVFRFTQGNGQRLDLHDCWEELATRLTRQQAYSSSRPVAKEETGIGWIDTDLYYAGDYAAFLWEVTKRKVPRSAVDDLLEARVRSLGLDKISRKMRTELKEDVSQELLQRALPDKRGHIAALHRENGTLFVQGVSVKHARSLANWVRRNMQDIGLDVGIPLEVLAELPAAVIDRFAAWARAEEVRGQFKLQFDNSTAVVSDERGSIKVSRAATRLSDDEEADAIAQVRESLLDAELQLNDHRQIIGCRIETLTLSEITAARYVFSANKPPVIAIPASTVGIGAQLYELIQAWEFLYKEIEAVLQGDLRLHPSDKEHDHQTATLLRPYAVPKEV